MKMDEIESNLLQEVDFNNADSWIQGLHYKGVLHQRRLKLLLQQIHQWSDYYMDRASISDKSKGLSGELVKVLSHAMFLFFCHQHQEDYYKIKRLRNNDILMDYSVEIQVLIRKLLSLMTLHHRKEGV